MNRAFTQSRADARADHHSRRRGQTESAWASDHCANKSTANQKPHAHRSQGKDRQSQRTMRAGQTLENGYNATIAYQEPRCRNGTQTGNCCHPAARSAIRGLTKRNQHVSASRRCNVGILTRTRQQLQHRKAPTYRQRRGRTTRRR